MTPDVLTPTVFHVLLALSEGPLHGYGVMQRVETESGLATGPGTIYGSLDRLAAMGWVEETDPLGDDPRRRRAYRLTRQGRAALQREVGRFQRLTELARSRGLLPGDAR
ncbi:MAG: helix-turn-helix transcriptional regulator [Gemmatimonadota bacterium]